MYFGKPLCTSNSKRVCTYDMLVPEGDTGGGGTNTVIFYKRSVFCPSSFSRLLACCMLAAAAAFYGWGHEGSLFLVPCSLFLVHCSPTPTTTPTTWCWENQVIQVINPPNPLRKAVKQEEEEEQMTNQMISYGNYNEVVAVIKNVQIVPLKCPKLLI